jgi:tetratricopeptide (TPR) repeat protein
MSRPAFETASLEDIPKVVTQGAPDWQPIRRRLGIAAFGVNAFTASEPGQPLVEDHTELEGGSAAHEELYLVLEGEARFVVDGQQVEAPAGTLVFVRDAGVRRRAEAVLAPVTVLAIGSPAGEAFVPAAWEFYRAAQPLAGEGDVNGARDVVEEGLRLHSDVPTLLYNLACYESLAGRPEEAVGHLRRAIELDPRTAAWAREDADFDPVRALPSFPV